MNDTITKLMKEFDKSRNLEQIHNFIPSGVMMIGGDHALESVLFDIDRADRMDVFTDPNANMGHSLALIYRGKLECYDIGKITEGELKIFNE